MSEQKVNPVELLRDAKGVYGIGLNAEFPFDDPPFGDELVPVYQQRYQPINDADAEAEMEFFRRLAGLDEGAAEPDRLLAEGGVPEPATAEERVVDRYHTYDRRPKTRPLILRPDRFPDGEELRYSDDNAALQMIPPRGFRRANSLEQQLDGVIAQFILHRCGAE